MDSKEKKMLLEEFYSKKRLFFVNKMKIYSGDLSCLKDMRLTKKEVARLLTKINFCKKS